MTSEVRRIMGASTPRLSYSTPSHSLVHLSGSMQIPRKLKRKAKVVIAAEKHGTKKKGRISTGAPSMSYNVASGGPGMSRNVDSGGPSTSFYVASAGPSMSLNVDSGGLSTLYKVASGGLSASYKVASGGLSMSRYVASAGPSMSLNVESGGTSTSPGIVCTDDDDDDLPKSSVSNMEYQLRLWDYLLAFIHQTGR